MGLKFRHKVFLTFLSSSFAMAICILLIGRYLGQRNFEDYVGKVEMQKAEEFSEALAQEYRKKGSWQQVLSNWNTWLQLVALGPAPPHRLSGEDGPPPPHPPGMGMHPGGGEPLEIIGPHPFPPGPPPEHRSHPPRICLFDPDKRPLIQTEIPVEGYRLWPIRVDEQLVGWMGMQRFERPNHPLDLEFIKHQSQMFYVTGAVALVLAVFMTFILSRHLLAPVKELAEGTRALTSRRFDTRVEIRSRDELGQLACDFNSMAQALEKHEQRQHQWISDISHELRTPLAVLRAEIEAMQDGVRLVGHEALESLHFEVIHVSRIVQDLHDLSLIESQSFSMNKCLIDPLKILNEMLGLFQMRFDRRGIQVESKATASSAIMVLADADRLRQLYSNLLENTLRYAHTPGLLHISSTLTPGQFVLSFEDSGPRVPEESLDRLFDRLYRVDKARSRTQGGSGLGLAICKSIVESSGGRIKAFHSPAGGLGIEVALPVRRDR